MNDEGRPHEFRLWVDSTQVKIVVSASKLGHLSTDYVNLRSEPGPLPPAMLPPRAIFTGTPISIDYELGSRSMHLPLFKVAETHFDTR